ncbi:MAG TPA: hypothetical protein PLI34_12260 [Saprospiraceae bacterium]|nr:hypothetical protein [Saprospiraceae bacterium]HRK82186.1 hypothetical protein [Saprospiraceae bacterium]
MRKYKTSGSLPPASNVLKSYQYYRHETSPNDRQTLAKKAGRTAFTAYFGCVWGITSRLEEGKKMKTISHHQKRMINETSHLYFAAYGSIGLVFTLL